MLHWFPSLVPAHRATASVRRAEESFRARRADHAQIRPSLHAAADDHWLANLAITRSHFLMSRSECARRAFAVNKQFLFFSIDNVTFQLGGVVRDVVNHLHREVFGATTKYFRKNFPNAMENHLSVRKRHVQSAFHRSEVIAAFRRVERRASQLAV